jgi:hypothetical protein
MPPAGVDVGSRRFRVDAVFSRGRAARADAHHQRRNFHRAFLRKFVT